MRQSLDEFFASHDLDRLKLASGWVVTRDADKAQIVRVLLRAADSEQYRLLFVCDGYPDAVPSVVFVDERDDKMVRSAWPTGNQQFLEYVKPPPSSFLCMPWTREGVQHHPNWLGVWNPEQHSLVDILNVVQRLLSGSTYSGRNR